MNLIRCLSCARSLQLAFQHRSFFMSFCVHLYHTSQGSLPDLTVLEVSKRRPFITVAVLVILFRKETWYAPLHNKTSNSSALSASYYGEYSLDLFASNIFIIIIVDGSSVENSLVGSINVIVWWLYSSIVSGIIHLIFDYSIVYYLSFRSWFPWIFSTRRLWLKFWSWSMYANISPALLITYLEDDELFDLSTIVIILPRSEL